MKEITGDIWSFLYKADIVIPVNCGWKKDGSNVMGAGLAKQAAERFPDLPVIWGALCLNYKDKIKVLRIHRDLMTGFGIIAFPTKSLDEKHPELSWKQPASLELIDRSTRQLARFYPQGAVLPLVGCGNGQLKEKDVLPILNRYLDDTFTLVRRGDA